MAGMRSTTAHENDAVVVVVFSKNVSPAASKLLWNVSQETNIIFFYPPLLDQRFFYGIFSQM